MMAGQITPALLAALMGEGVRAQQIERAVAAVRDVKPGEAISELAHRNPDLRSLDSNMIRAFVFEQAGRLERRAELTGADADEHHAE